MPLLKTALKSMSSTKKYWKGLEELHEESGFLESTQNEFPERLPVEEFLGDEETLKESSTTRRDFLKFLGFSVTAATLAACEAPVIKAIPYVNKPEDITPGVANWYSSTYYDGNDFANILVKTREGRPIFIKGNAQFGITGGGVNARINSSVLSLYNGARLNGPQAKDGSKISWDQADAKISKKLKQIAAEGKAVRVLTSSIASPSTEMAIGELVSSLGGTEESSSDVKQVVYDAVSYAGIRKANQDSFGKNVIPSYDFSEAKVIVGVGADFISSWLSSVEYDVQYSSKRHPVTKDEAKAGKWMSKHFQYESILSRTGSVADYRTAIKPSEEGQVVAAIYKHLGGNVSGLSISAEIVAKTKDVAKELKENRGASLVVAGSNDPNVQTLVNAINSKLGNYGKTIDLNDELKIAQGQDGEVEQLIKEMKSGKVGALVVYGTNPAYSLPNKQDFIDGLEKTFSVSFSDIADETASRCDYICPDNHYLESWNDFNPKKSHYAIAQPVISPLFDTRQAQETMLVWAGKAEREGKKSKVFYNCIKENWRKYGYPMVQDVFSTFDDYWNTMVHNGSGSIKLAESEEKSVLFSGNVSAAVKSISKTKSATEGDFELVLYQKEGLGLGHQAANPILQELPDPISRVTWDNYITMSPNDMEAAGYNIHLGQKQPASVAKVTANNVELELPVVASPGQKQGTVGIALGYGRGADGENIGKAAFETKQYGGYKSDAEGKKVTIGKNAYPFQSFVNGFLLNTTVVSIASTGSEQEMAATQTHHTIMGRDSILKETTLDTYQKGEKHLYNHGHTLPVHEDVNGDGKINAKDAKSVNEFTLWAEQPVENVGHRWGLSIDLNSCTGCGACVTACTIENNVPIVGKDEVRRVREMHWLKIDRYYSSAGTRETGYGSMEKPETGDDVEVMFQPMLCQHCNHAPCETVCPVAATTHSNEGLNQMTYNRCIGTRYCGNNCPFKVRRFNWFNYPTYKKFTEFNPAQDQLGRMVLNPDVVVRTRGVMEKCSMCVQQIQAGKLTAKKEERRVNDGDIQTACSATCASGAIKFGDLNDEAVKGYEGSQVYQDSKDDRAYNALEEIGVKPNIYYMTKVRNKKKEETGHTAEHH